MEDDKKCNIEDDKNNSKWKMTKSIKKRKTTKKIKMEDDKKNQNRIRTKKSKWKTAKKI